MTLSELIVHLEKLRAEIEMDVPVYFGPGVLHPVQAKDLVTYDSPVWGEFRVGLGKLPA